MLIPAKEDRTSRAMDCTWICLEVKIPLLLLNSPWCMSCLCEHTVRDFMRALNNPAKNTAFSVTTEIWIYRFIISDYCVICKMSLFTVDTNLLMKVSFLRVRLSKPDDTKHSPLKRLRLGGILINNFSKFCHFSLEIQDNSYNLFCLLMYINTSL